MPFAGPLRFLQTEHRVVLFSMQVHTCYYGDATIQLKSKDK